MNRIYSVILLLIICFIAKAQVTNDSTYLRVAEEQFCKRLQMYRSVGNGRSLLKGISCSDTINIVCILPLYYIPISYVDSCVDALRVDSRVDDVFNWDNNADNQVFIVANRKYQCIGYLEKGIIEEFVSEYPQFINRDYLLDNVCSLKFEFNLKGITNYKKFIDFMSERSRWSFFVLNEFPGVWAFDEQHRLLHIYQRRRYIEVEDGQNFYEKYVTEVGIEKIKCRIKWCY